MFGGSFHGEEFFGEPPLEGGLRRLWKLAARRIIAPAKAALRVATLAPFQERTVSASPNLPDRTTESHFDGETHVSMDEDL